MKPKEFLDQPIKVMVPSGFKACLDCERYFLHQAIWCPSCGKEIIAWKEISIADLIRKTAKGGTGAVLTVWSYLHMSQGIKIFEGTLNKENQAIYDLAKKIYREAGGKSFRGKKYIK